MNSSYAAFSCDSFASCAGRHTPDARYPQCQDLGKDLESLDVEHLLLPVNTSFPLHFPFSRPFDFAFLEYFLLNLTEPHTTDAPKSPNKLRQC